MTRRETAYSDEYFDRMEQDVLASARVVVPILQRVIEPASVVDVGCGRGAWLKAFEEQGVPRVKGLDGSHVDIRRVLLARNSFQAVDLSRPFSIEGTYDLALCLEVAEHLPSRMARTLVRRLTAAAPLVLFSAAVPGQPGVEHLNERWPSYWRNLFAEFGFERLDPVRRHIWHDRRVKWWYRQNLFLFASRQSIALSTSLQEEAAAATPVDLEWVHRRVLENLLVRYSTPGGIVREARAALGKQAGRRLDRWLRRRG